MLYYFLYIIQILIFNLMALRL